MSEKENDLGLDLDLHFLPAWAQKPAGFSEFAHHPGERDDRGKPPRRRDARPRRQNQPPQGPQRPSAPHANRPSRPKPPPREQIPPLPWVKVSFLPDERGVESLARQIKFSGRAYPLFEIAYMILKKPERHNIRFEAAKPADGAAPQSLYLCALDETLWPSEAEAIHHVLGRHFATFYQTDRTPADPPKGTYTFVAQCGMSGTILGPPNYHDYQNKLRKLHAERFSRVPFDVFKARVKIVRDEAIVKKWIEEQSCKVEYVALNIPETVKFSTREEVDAHFRQVHLPNVIKAVDSHTLSGVASRQMPSGRLQAQLRYAWDDQMRFPLQVVNILSRQFASQGLHFFKVNRTVTHVSVARPRYLDLVATPVSEGIRKIVEFIQTHPKCSRRDLIQAWTPQPPTSEAAKEPASDQPAPEATAMIADLHWLIHEGHVIEFADGRLELAKLQIPKPETTQRATAKQPAPASSPAEERPAPAEAVETEEAPANVEENVSVEISADAETPAPQPETAEHGETVPAQETTE